MAAKGEQTPMCEKHKFKIDTICEDCEEFICWKCAETDHKDHDSKSIPTDEKDLKKLLGKIEEKIISDYEMKQMQENQRSFDSEADKIQEHFDAITTKLKEIKSNFEVKLREDMKRKNSDVRMTVSDLGKMKKKDSETLSEFIRKYKDLTNLISNMQPEEPLVRYRRGDINEDVLLSIMGNIFTLHDISVTDSVSFKYGDKAIVVLQAIDEDSCYVRDSNSDYIKQVNKRNEKKNEINLKVNDICIVENGDVFVTDGTNHSIVHLSPSGSVSEVFSTAPLTPGDICKEAEGGLLFTLKNIESKSGPPISLVRHMTVTGDVIHDYEYQEDGQTRLFTISGRVRQNGNSDICVVNWLSKKTGELLILAFSGSLRSVYRGQKDPEPVFHPSDIVCDSHWNIIVCDLHNSEIHLLSPSGKFIKYLLTKTELTHPCSMSLYKSTLWVGDSKGIVKVFQYND